jgi:hypothetical protein
MASYRTITVSDAISRIKSFDVDITPIHGGLSVLVLGKRTIYIPYVDCIGSLVELDKVRSTVIYIQNAEQRGE